MTVQNDILFLLFVNLGIISMMILNVKTDMRMHKAHAEMINFLLDNLIADQKAAIAGKLDKYLADNKITRH